jgi:hypothetical protein
MERLPITQAHDAITVTISPAEYTLLQKLQVIRDLVKKHSKGKTVSEAQSEHRKHNHNYHHQPDVICPSDILASFDTQQHKRTASPASSHTTVPDAGKNSTSTSSASTSSPSSRSNSSHTSHDSAVTRFLNRELLDNAYGFDEFCRNFNPKDPHIVRLLELLVEETVDNKRAALNMQCLETTNHQKVGGNQTAADDLDDYFRKSPVPVDFEFIKAQPSHRRMLEQAITNGYYSSVGSASPSFDHTLSLSSADNTPPPLDLKRTAEGFTPGEDEHWRRLYNRRLQRERGRAEAPSYIQHALFRPSSVDSLASSVMNPPSNVSSRESSQPRWVYDDGPLTAPNTGNIAWDIYDDSSLEGLEVQSIEGVCLSSSWE